MGAPFHACGYPFGSGLKGNKRKSTVLGGGGVEGVPLIARVLSSGPSLRKCLHPWKRMSEARGNPHRWKAPLLGGGGTRPLPKVKGPFVMFNGFSLVCLLPLQTLPKETHLKWVQQVFTFSPAMQLSGPV